MKGGTPHAFHSKTLHEYEAKYNFVEKKAFTIVKGLKKFRHLIAGGKVMIYVTQSSVQEYIMEGEITNKRANWTTKILECDIEVRPTKMIKGKWLYEYLAHTIESPIVEEIPEKILINQFESDRSWVADRI